MNLLEKFNIKLHEPAHGKFFKRLSKNSFRIHRDFKKSFRMIFWNNFWNFWIDILRNLWSNLCKVFHKYLCVFFFFWRIAGEYSEWIFNFLEELLKTPERDFLWFFSKVIPVRISLWIAERVLVEFGWGICEAMYSMTTQ